ncbi:hypothetical protein M9H77_21227 [Catharanthus roseus]|uniref:Uncharacterized protein n=1 Tax=Catharanthus roseus TaxID=4058 RepID=A0ACC0AP26_CATRO|nr:hypothetical protein M9H77_21227 [Catharanthus roseus]
MYPIHKFTTKSPDPWHTSHIHPTPVLLLNFATFKGIEGNGNKQVLTVVVLVGGSGSIDNSQLENRKDRRKWREERMEERGEKQGCRKCQRLSSVVTKVVEVVTELDGRVGVSISRRWSREGCRDAAVEEE